MTPQRLQEITSRYGSLHVAVLGDFCLDRYLEIDPAREERSIETGLPVHNVLNVRAQPGGAGTILNNLAALGIGAIYPIGFAGYDGEGFELWHALEWLPGVQLTHFVRTKQRRTFTYCKPLLCGSNQPPVELNRLDSKNWTPTPALLQGLLVNGLTAVAQVANVIIVLDQVDLPETGVVTQKVLDTLGRLLDEDPSLLVLADSRRGLRGYPPAVFKMNAAELSALSGTGQELSLNEIKETAAALAQHNHRSVFVTLAERGILGATAAGEVEHVASLPVRGPIDVVGAGDAVSANLTAAMAAGANLREALELANAAASVVVHKVGTTGTATIFEIAECLLKS
ncbi:MAG TPA: PfkB family carbohydrate kinase [Candidatus Acidoferrum sp.]|jgi:rfaE bifunctional protein kinase chain/domain|nr:PfkB family carbohydrate kinase [Candidatus Acidoferrum sp.]